MKKLLLSILTVSSVALVSNAQDVHFTQYFKSPLTLNPAQTGLIDGDWRASANFRTQWYNLTPNPYITGTVAYDMPLLRGKLPDGDALGIGVLGLFDKAGSGGLQNTTLGISLAYHKAFGMNKQHTVSFGVQGYLVQKSIDFSKLTFGDQYDPSMPDYLRPVSNENFSTTDLTYPDFNVGLLYSGKVSENATLYGGFSMYHLTRPEESFLNSSSEAVDLKINHRFAGFLGGSFDVNENITTYVSTTYVQQGSAWEYLIGGAVGFVLNPGHSRDVGNTTLYLGGWYRFEDAFAPYIGLEWTNMSIGFSFDVTTSSLATAVKNQGAYEVSLVYNGFINKVMNRSYNFACPKF